MTNLLTWRLTIGSTPQKQNAYITEVSRFSNESRANIDRGSDFSLNDTVLSNFSAFLFNRNDLALTLHVRKNLKPFIFFRGRKVKLKLISALAASLLSAAPVFAETITLDFEGAATSIPSDSFNFLNSFYNGGTNSGGTAGVNYGVSFAGAAYALSNAYNPDPVYSNAPSMGAVMSTTDSDGAMSVASGFSGTVSFYYSSAEAATVNVWSGINGTGSILATFALGANAQTNCSDTSYCHWDFISLDLGSNIAHSIQFGDAIGTGFDNVTVNAVPVPAAAWLMGSALLGLGGVSRRRAQR